MNKLDTQRNIVIQLEKEVLLYGRKVTEILENKIPMLNREAGDLLILKRSTEGKFQAEMDILLSLEEAEPKSNTSNEVETHNMNA